MTFLFCCYKNKSWVEIDPQAIVDSVTECIEKVAEYLAEMGLSHKQIKSKRILIQKKNNN